MSIRKMARFAEGLRILMERDPTRRHPNILYIEQTMQSSSHFYLVTNERHFAVVCAARPSHTFTRVSFT